MPNNWKKYKFSDFVEINPTIRFSKDELYSFVEMKDLNENNKFVLPSTEKGVTGGARFGENDTLFARITPCLQNGKICQVKGLKKNVGFGSTEFLVFRGKHGISDTNFVYYLSREEGVRKFAEQNMIGTSGRQRVVKDAFQNLLLELPPLPEQTAIAEILSALDDKIELNLQTNKTLEEMANALYKHWFVDFAPFLPPGRCLQDGRGPIPGFVESELGMIPEGFDIVSFKDVCFNHSKTFNFKNKERVIFVNTGDILEGKFLHSNYSDVDGLPGQAKKIIEHDDILFSEIRPGNKRYALINFDAPEYVVSTKFMVIRANDKILPRILYRILRDEKIIKEFQSIAESRSGTFPQITFDAISHINFCMGNIEIQNKFMDSVLPLEKLIESNNLEIESLKQTRDYLLPKLISGEIRVKDINIKKAVGAKNTSRPADTLLKGGKIKEVL